MRANRHPRRCIPAGACKFLSLLEEQSTIGVRFHIVSFIIRVILSGDQPASADVARAPPVRSRDAAAADPPVRRPGFGTYCGIEGDGIPGTGTLRIVIRVGDLAVGRRLGCLPERCCGCPSEPRSDRRGSFQADVRTMRVNFTAITAAVMTVRRTNAYTSSPIPCLTMPRLPKK